MTTIRLVTEAYAPDQTVILRWSPNWETDRGGVYVDGAWTFDLDETAFPDGLEFIFLLAPGRRMQGDNLLLPPEQLPGVHDYQDVVFPPATEAIVENPAVAQRYFPRNLSPDHVYDVIVVGSGMGGGILASRLAAQGADVLLLEAGSYLFPTHVGNLPRRLRIGRFDKHVWSLWGDFRVVKYRNTPGSTYDGGQAFALGGRSLFWGGLVPRQEPWELSAWPAAVRDHLLSTGYPLAEAQLGGAEAPDPDDYQTSSRTAIQGLFPGFTATDARVAVQYRGASKLGLGAGLFSTADLLFEDRLLDDPGQTIPVVDLNTAVQRVIVSPDDPTRVTGVVAWDMLGRRQRTYQGRTVVLSAGSIESAKIALQSGLNDPSGLIGRGITDHTIRYRHFVLPPGSPYADATQSAKVVLRHPAASRTAHPYLAVVELGADLNQGRYVDPAHLALERAARSGWMLCELVFLHYADLAPGHGITVTGDPGDDVGITMYPVPPADAVIAETDALAAAFFAAVGAQPVLGEDGLSLQTAPLGGVAHEVGTLRMSDDGTGVVDGDLRFVGYENLYACDNSVFPASPAANPSLTTAALAIRLAAHLHG